MIIREFGFRSFRNLEDAVISPGPGVNLVLGENGQGKTNLLEAIWLCTGARSFRGAKQAELPTFGRQSCLLEAGVANKKREIKLTISLGAEKFTRMNGVDLPKKADFTGNLICVAFSPIHLGLVSGGPEGRRNFLDASLCQSSRKYLDQLTRYRAYLHHKNALLRQEIGEKEKNFLLDGYDEKLALYGFALKETRRQFLEQLAEESLLAYETLSGGKEKLTVKYQPGAKAESVEEFAKELKAARMTDLKNLSCSRGPHKDDVELLLDDKNARIYGSQGQRRSIVLALKLSEASLLERRTGESPVILLDDVLSELDNRRQDHLLNRITGRQIFVSACEEQKSGVLAEGKNFYVKEGRISEKPF